MKFEALKIVDIEGNFLGPFNISWIHTDLFSFCIIRKPDDLSDAMITANGTLFFNTLLSEVNSTKRSKCCRLDNTRFIIDYQCGDIEKRFMEYIPAFIRNHCCGVDIEYIPPNLIEGIFQHARHAYKE